MDQIVRELKNIYPDIKWELSEPNDDILKNFGNGTILTGYKGLEKKDFFILQNDKKKIMWGHVIANYLNRTMED